jgi:hypothetical protein
VTAAATVNCDAGWVPGTRGCGQAWGFCFEGGSSDPEQPWNQQRAIAVDSNVADNPLANAVEGSLIHVVVDATARAISVAVDGGVPVALAIDLDSDAPLALALSLKYAGDAVELVAPP